MENKNKKITIRFTENERNEIQKQAKQNSLTISNYCRNKIMQGTTEKTIDFPKIHELIFNIKWLCDGFEGNEKRKDKLESQLEALLKCLEDIQ